VQVQAQPIGGFTSGHNFKPLGGCNVPKGRPLACFAVILRQSTPKDRQKCKKKYKCATPS
jgi:hypothetical protein